MLFDITTFTLIHTLISLVAIAAGLVVVGGLMAGQRLDGSIDQLFRRIPALIVLAPTHKEPPYLLTQLLVLGLGIAAFKRFHPAGVMVARSARMPATVGGR